MLFLVALGVENPPKIDPKSDQKEDAILNATWKALGPIFDGFWLQNGGVGGSWGLKNQEKSILGGVLGGLGGILGPKSQKRSARLDLNDRFGTPNGGQNLLKINFLGFEEVLIF